MTRLHVVGGGLAGTEAAWQAAERGIDVTLYEMRPKKTTPAHMTNNLAELVCSNSLGSKLSDRASGLLKNEMKVMGSLLMRCAEAAAVPAGGALAVDREAFSKGVEDALNNHPNITMKMGVEVTEIPDEPTIIASGPLTSTALAEDIGRLTGEEYLYFYDALAPLVDAESINMDIAYRANRWDKGDTRDGDYINCAMNQEQYEAFVQALIEGEKIELRDFEEEDPHFFEGCLPVEQIAARGEKSLAFGPLRPVGLRRDPDHRPYAVVQLRQDNLAGTLYNMVGFQTNLKWPEQRRIFKMIPGLENARFVRLGQMHRNTFLNAPTLLRQSLQFHNRDDLFFAGQITGIEGYAGNIGTGLIAGVNAANFFQDKPMWHLPETSMMGALIYYVTHAEPKHFQPMKANFDLVPKFEEVIKNKRQRKQMYADRALSDLSTYLQSMQFQPIAIAE